ncbi:MAG: 16S rRNA (cytosine(967)-C(5))-methyltransferase RsmB [Clostridia bacterium]|nr:16S rRNA (cytosine(967)-C(5))-methyltransferase RsmB [Clostridia bacterium]
MSPNPRKKAVNMLLDIEKKSSYVNIEMNKLRALDDFSPIDIRFIGEIVNGVIKRKITLDYIIAKHSNVKLNKISPFILAVLRSAIYQILFMDKVPDSAAVNESVKIVKKSSVNRLSSYVNAVLRAVSQDDISSIDQTNIQGLSIYHSFPEWIVERWVNRFGFEFAQNLLFSLNQKAPLCIRRNVNMPQEDLSHLLNEYNIESSPVVISQLPDFDYCMQINVSKTMFTDTAAFKNGDFYIQDAAAALAAYLLEPQAGDKVIDMCAAPGGKSLFAAELMANSGSVVSFDIYEHKLDLISENCARHNISIVSPVLQDSSVFNPEYENSADKIICDVPCSGFGIIRKKPDIRYARTESDIAELAKLSYSILENAARYLKSGGTMVFSTCTIEQTENEDVIHKFLDKHKDFSLYPFTKSGIAYKTFYPHIDDTDGFFVCRLKKNGDNP